MPGEGPQQPMQRYTVYTELTIYTRLFKSGITTGITVLLNVVGRSEFTFIPGAEDMRSWASFLGRRGSVRGRYTDFPRYVPENRNPGNCLTATRGFILKGDYTLPIYHVSLV